jgi:hypothetical protein
MTRDGMRQEAATRIGEQYKRYSVKPDLKGNAIIILREDYPYYGLVAPYPYWISN